MNRDPPDVLLKTRLVGRLNPTKLFSDATFLIRSQLKASVSSRIYGSNKLRRRLLNGPSVVPCAHLHVFAEEQRRSVPERRGSDGNAARQAPTRTITDP